MTTKINKDYQNTKRKINVLEKEILKAIEKVMDTLDVSYSEIDAALIRILKSNNDDINYN